MSEIFEDAKQLKKKTIEFLEATDYAALTGDKEYYLNIDIIGELIKRIIETLQDTRTELSRLLENIEEQSKKKLKYTHIIWRKEGTVGHGHEINLETAKRAAEKHKQ
ncbi:MAG: hypothetical protein Q6363_007740 [Candidatus Njordarchaeota archaeon]